MERVLVVPVTRTSVFLPLSEQATPLGPGEVPSLVPLIADCGPDADPADVAVRLVSSADVQDVEFGLELLLEGSDGEDYLYAYRVYVAEAALLDTSMHEIALVEVPTIIGWTTEIKTALTLLLALMPTVGT